jgi:hypothetical protein
VSVLHLGAIVPRFLHITNEPSLAVAGAIFTSAFKFSFSSACDPEDFYNICRLLHCVISLIACLWIVVVILMASFFYTFALAIRQRKRCYSSVGLFFMRCHSDILSAWTGKTPQIGLENLPGGAWVQEHV